MASFTELPTELLLEVASYLDSNDFTPYVSLALACRCFYDVFMIWIQEEQIRHFSQMLETTRLRIKERTGIEVQDMAEGNTTSHRTAVADPFRTSIGKLRFAVGGTEKELQSVLGVICRARYLEEVQLDLGYSCSQRRVARAIKVCIAQPSLRLKVLGAVPDFQTGPFRCESDMKYRASVHNSRFLAPDEDLVRPVVQVQKARKATAFKSFFASFTRPFSKNRNQPDSGNGTIDSLGDHVLPSLSSGPDLATLVVPKFRFKHLPLPQFSVLSAQSDSLFLPSIYPVTLHALNNSPIHTLSLSNLKLTTSDWSGILPAIAMRFLRSLSIGEGVTIQFLDLSTFLGRHKLIQNLDLACNHPIGYEKFSQRKNFLPRLASMTGNSDYLAIFLKYKRAGYFPCLQTISIVDEKLSQEALYDQLFATGFLHDTSLRLDHSSYLALIAWLLDDVMRQQSLPLTGVTSLSAAVFRIRNVDFETYLDEATKGRLDHWALNNPLLVEESVRRRSGRPLLDDYLEKSEALICSAGPKLKGVIYYLTDE